MHKFISTLLAGVHVAFATRTQQDISNSIPAYDVAACNPVSLGELRTKTGEWCLEIGNQKTTGKIHTYLCNGTDL